jgi:septal ring factor EnvC (AmiA/AmiB activator)
VTNVRAQVERRLREKDEEFEGTRRNHQRALESMRASLDAELKTKHELQKSRKKLEADINELEVRWLVCSKKTIEYLTASLTDKH